MELGWGMVKVLELNFGYVTYKMGLAVKNILYILFIYEMRIILPIS